MKKLLICAAACLVLLLLMLNFDDSPVLRLAYCSPEDVYGNDVLYVEVWQYNGSAWTLIVNFTGSVGNAKLHDNWEVKFIVGIRFNSSLASSNSEAIEYTRVFMNITHNGSYIWQNNELNNISCVLNGDFYYLKEEGIWNVDLPQEGETYDFSVLYQGYY